MNLPSWSRLRPVAAIIVVLILVQLGSGFYAYRQSKEILLESKLTRAESLTEGLIVAIIDPLIHKDFSTMESRIMQTMYNDEVLSIQVTDMSGKVLVHLARAPGNEPVEVFDHAHLTLPSGVDLTHWHEGNEQTIVCWEKLNAGVDFGWIRLEMIGAVESRELNLIKQNAVTLSIISMTLALTFLGVFLWRSYFTAIRRELTATTKLQDTAELLYQSEKMAALGQLSAGLAHEINNPIGYVSSNISSLMSYFEIFRKLLSAYEDKLKSVHEHIDPREIDAIRNDLNFDFIQEDVDFLLSETLEGIQRVRSIVQDLKDFSRAEKTAAWSKADLHKGIASTLNIVASEFKDRADVELVFGVLPEIECLPSQVNQVILNLLVNATQAIPKATKGLIRVTTRADDTHVYFDVSDTGSGISEENLKNIFNPFFTTKEVGSGTGLGLSVVHGIIERHHGAISVESVVGKGTTFTVSLPIKQA